MTLEKTVTFSLRVDFADARDLFHRVYGMDDAPPTTAQKEKNCQSSQTNSLVVPTRIPKTGWTHKTRKRRTHEPQNAEHTHTHTEREKERETEREIKRERED